MTNFRFGIDIDGTVTCPTSLLPHINAHFGVNLRLDDIQEYDLTKAFQVDPNTFYTWYRSAEDQIYRTSPAQAFAKQVLEDWKAKYELYYISARGQHVFDSTMDWFRKEAIPYDHIELVGSHDKIEAARKHRVHLFFEDKHDNAVDISEELDIPVLLFDTPYNRKPAPSNVIRVYDWKEANEWVQQHFPLQKMFQNT